MELIKKKLQELEALCEKHPDKIPCEEVAKFLGMGADGLRAALLRKNTPFGFGYQQEDNKYRVLVIPTAQFYLWYTNTSAQMVLGKAIV